MWKPVSGHVEGSYCACSYQDERLIMLTSLFTKESFSPAAVPLMLLPELALGLMLG